MHVVITGTNRGIGQELERRYSEQGHTVTGTSRQGPPANRLDVANPASHAKFAQRLDGMAIDLLICNAGVFVDKGQQLADGFPPDMWAKTFETNVTGVFLTIQSLLPNLLLAASPKIAIISSRLGSQELASGGRGYIYRASKAAVINLGRHLSSDLQPSGIALGIYHPGWVRTEMGGDDGDIDVAASAKGLIETINTLSLDTTGCFLDYQGQTVPF